MTSCKPTSYRLMVKYYFPWESSRAYQAYHQNNRSNPEDENTGQLKLCFNVFLRIV